MAGSNCRRIHHLACVLRMLLPSPSFVRLGLGLDKIRRIPRSRDPQRGVPISFDASVRTDMLAYKPNCSYELDNQNYVSMRTR
jgi:hypothetical protein